MAYGDITKPDDTDIPLCKDCNHFSRDLSQVLFFDYKRGKCLRPTGSSTVNVITGKEETKKLRAFAIDERIGGQCGMQGKFWFSDKKKDLFTVLKRS